MPITNVDAMIIDGQPVYFRPGQVIAIGEPARDFVESLAALPSGPETSVLDPGSSGSPRPPAFRFTGIAEPLAVVGEARAEGFRVQLNHVFFAYGCHCCDPCCGANPFDADPFNASSFDANPFNASPFNASQRDRTSAKPAELANPLDDLEPNAGDRPDVTVWVLDTGLAADGFSTPLDALVGPTITGQNDDHPDHVPQQQPDGHVDPVAGHGTFIAGIVERLIPGCQIEVRSTIDAEGVADEWDVANEIENLVVTAANPARTILNLSFGGGLSPDVWRVADAIAFAREAGVVVVASAGNEGSCVPVYPAAFPGVTAVGALAADGKPAPFTNRGSWVNACALGVDIVSTFFDLTDHTALEPPFRGWATWSGTSFAAPVVVAAIAQRLRDGAGTAVAARKAVLDGGATVTCLGVKVEPDGIGALVG